MTQEEKEKLAYLCNPKGKIILDVGCGNGRFSDFFSENCKKYIGIDIDENQINMNNKNNDKENVEYETVNIINYHPKEKFDIIFLSLAFHEIDIEEQGLALKNMLGLLKKDGIIIIFDPELKEDSFQGLWNIAYRSLNFYEHDYSVKHSKEVIEKAIREHLCRVVKKDYIEIPFEFNDYNEILEMFINDDEFKDTKWDDKTKERLLSDFKKVFKNKGKLDIYDKLYIIVLKKEGEKK